MTEKWLISTQETYNDLINKNPSKENAILLAACKIILNDNKPQFSETYQLIQEANVPIYNAPKANIVKGEYTEKQLIDKIKDELQDGENYLDMFEITGDRNYIQISYDESTHAKFLLNIAQERGYDVEYYQSRLQDLQERISKL